MARTRLRIEADAKASYEAKLKAKKEKAIAETKLKADRLKAIQEREMKARVLQELSVTMAKVRQEEQIAKATAAEKQRVAAERDSVKQVVITTAAEEALTTFKALADQVSLQLVQMALTRQLR